MIPGQEPYTEAEAAQLAALVADAAAGDPGEANEAAAIAAAILATPGEANARAEAARKAHDAARSAAYEAERTQRTAQEDAKTAEKVAGRLIRALAHVADGVTVGPSEYGGRTEYRATFGHAAVWQNASSGRWSSKAQPQVAVAVAVGWTLGESIDLYRSARGTSDPAKLEAETAAAHKAAAEWAAGQTARAWLTAAGIAGSDADLQALAAALVSVDFDLEANWYGDASYLSPRWRVRAGGARLNDGHALNSWDIYPDAAERDPIDHASPEAPKERTPATWDAYAQALDAHWNTQEARTRAVALALA